jgi:hypothetical protein
MVRESTTRFSRRKPDPRVLDGLIADIRYVPGTFDDDERTAPRSKSRDS